MKLNCKLFLFVAVLAAALLPRAAFADAVTVTLTNAVQSVSTTTGGTLIYSGSVKNTSNVTQYFNGDSYNATGPYTFSDDAYVNNLVFGLVSLDAGQSYVGELFRLSFGSGLSANSYIGSFILQGGTTDSDLSTLTTVRFQANVTAPAAVAATPEPSSLLLLGTGLVGGVGLLRRRFQN